MTIKDQTHSSLLIVETTCILLFIHTLHVFILLCVILQNVVGYDYASGFMELCIDEVIQYGK